IRSARIPAAPCRYHERICDEWRTNMARSLPGTGATSTFRDLNKNGRLDPYEDPRCPIEERVEDLLAQMTLPEKAGMLFQTMAWLDEALGRPLASEMITTRLMNHFNLIGGGD